MVVRVEGSRNFLSREDLQWVLLFALGLGSSKSWYFSESLIGCRRSSNTIFFF